MFLRLHADAGMCRTLVPFAARVRFFVVYMVCVFFVAPASAVELDVQQELDFGVIAVRDNSFVSSIRIRHRGVPVATASGGGILIVEPGQPGRYRLRNLPSNSPLEITVVPNDDLTPGGQGGAERFPLHSFTLDDQSSDAGGEAVFTIGGTADSTGNSLPYGEGGYIGAFDIELRYWSPPDQAFVERTFGVFARGEVRSSIALEQLEPIRFGILSAFADNAQRARLVMSPSGSLSVDNQSPASITPLGGAAPGRARVTGAAPLQVLRVEFDPATVVVDHVGIPGSARFFASEFTHAPTGLAFRTDANGVLEFSVGATLETELTASTYAEGNYSGVVTVVVDY